MTASPEPLPHKEIGVAVIYNEQGLILIDRRLEGGFFGGLWEFPGGKVEAEETVPDCIRREILEELGISIEIREHLLTLTHTYRSFHITLHVYLCLHQIGEPQTLQCQEIRWVTLEEIDEFQFPEANSQIITALKTRQKPCLEP
jgi:A/G-specific adenine glycosylase